MKPDYQYIIDAVGKDPVWWDLYGVPHFDDPPYPHLTEWIRCQRCGEPFYVGLWTPVYVSDPSNPNIIRIDKSFESDGSSLELSEKWGYRDPPLHGCVGDTMISIPQYDFDQYNMKPIQ